MELEVGVDTRLEVEWFFSRHWSKAMVMNGRCGCYHLMWFLWVQLALPYDEFSGDIDSAMGWIRVSNKEWRG